MKTGRVDGTDRRSDGRALERGRLMHLMTGLLARRREDAWCSLISNRNG
jgi:hypothetical protein